MVLSRGCSCADGGEPANVSFASTSHHITSTTHGGEPVLLVEAKTTRAVRVKTEDALDRAADGVQLEYSKTEALRYAGKEGIQPLGLWLVSARSQNSHESVVCRVQYLGKTPSSSASGGWRTTPHGHYRPADDRRE